MTTRTIHEHALECGHKFRSRHHLAAALCGRCKTLSPVTAMTTYDVDDQGRVVRGARS